MKKTILGFLLSLPICVLAQQESFKIEASLKKAPAKSKAFITYRSTDGAVTDSVVLKNGKFTFQGALSAPTLIKVSVSNGASQSGGKKKPLDIYELYADKGTIRLTGIDSIKYATFEGPELGKEYVSYSKLLEKSTQGLAGIEQEWLNASPEEKKDPQFLENLRAKSKTFSDDKRVVQRQYIQANPNSYFSLVALQEVAGYQLDPAVIEPQFNQLAAEVKNSELGKAFAKRIDIVKLTSIGMLAPDFTQNDVDGKPVSLSDFRGQYVLLDFWASWCGPCRAENPHVVEAYHKYKDQKFTVLGVSLDNPGQKAAWLKAIEDDKLTWTQVSDLQGWKNEASTLYGVRGIPQNYLIGPDGRILASNLRGEALDKKLAEILEK